MPRPSYKGKKSWSGRHVQLPEYLQATEAWATMKPGPRALYIELRRRFNGSNNGKLWLSHRDAAKAICVSKNTVGGYFQELKQRGFIDEGVVGHLGVDGLGHATSWVLTELPTPDGKAPTKRFLEWRKQKPVPKTGSVRPRIQDTQ